MRTDEENILLFNAFNGFGDTTGSDDYGISAAWLDTHDYLEDCDDYSRNSDEITKQLESAGYGRWLIVILTDNGMIQVQQYESKSDMMDAYHAIEDDYSQRGGQED
jgi:hypothetical protein